MPAKTHSDRMIYARRDVGTRSRVNWYRGAPDKDDTIPGSFNETTTAPDQTTHYETSDDPNADPDNPAADGEGSRHNYEVIGQVPISYDNNRNVMADGTREFRYNYRNQLRSVWRKSDGEDSGRVAMYREDAFGRRVLAWTWWELSRRVYFDTRFERDIDLDPDGDSTDMEIIDGGITSNAVTEQTASWESRIYRPYNASFEAHYYDFLVHVPTPTTSTAYLGKVAVGTRELRIYGDRYELYNNTTWIDTYNAPGGSTAGWRNIGLRAGIGADTYIDGIATGIGGALLGVNQTVEFGTLSVDDGPGIRLFDNLNYLRSFNRTLAGASGGGYPMVSAEGSSQAAMLCGYTQGGGGVQLLDGGPFGTDFMPRVKATGFDGPAAQSMFELTADGESVETAVAVEYEEDSTRARHFTGDGEFTNLYLVNPRRGTAVTVRDDADGLLDVEGELVEGEELLPGAHIYLHHDAVGAVTGSMRVDPAAPSLPWGESGGDNVRALAVYELESLPMLHGNGAAEGDFYIPLTTIVPPPEDPGTYHGEPPEFDGDGWAYTAGSETCCFSDDDPTDEQGTSRTDTSTGNQQNSIGGQWDPLHGIQFGDGTGGSFFIGWIKEKAERIGENVKYYWENPGEYGKAVGVAGAGMVGGAVESCVPGGAAAVRSAANAVGIDTETYKDIYEAGEVAGEVIGTGAQVGTGVGLAKVAGKEAGEALAKRAIQKGISEGGEKAGKGAARESAEQAGKKAADAAPNGKPNSPNGQNRSNSASPKGDGSTPTEGIYEFPDKKAGGKPYVGESGEIPTRLRRHERAGKLERGTESCTEVLGGKTAREVAEHKRIQELTGGQRAKNSPNVANKKDPIGPDRRPEHGLPEPTE